MDKNLPTLSQFDPKKVEQAAQSLVKKWYAKNEEMARVNLEMDLAEQQQLAKNDESYDKIGLQ